jgi:purine-binding chemotaxis protein CheW
VGVSAPTAQQVVTFRVAEEQFAADVAAVERILRYERPVGVPHLPEWVEGVLEYQGRVVPVIDLRRRFQLERGEGGDADETRADGDGRVIVFAVGSEWVGAVVDAVLEVTAVPTEQVSPPPSLFRGLSADYLRGLVRRDDGRMLIFLEVDRLLTATERLRLEQGFGGEGRDA